MTCECPFCPSAVVSKVRRQGVALFLAWDPHVRARNRLQQTLTDNTDVTMLGQLTITETADCD